MSCCSELFCKRKRPVLIRQGSFTEQWFAVTGYTEHDGLIRASNGGKHDITDQMQHWLNEAYQAGLRDGLTGRDGS